MILQNYNKEDITQPVTIPKDNWKDTLQQIIKGCVKNEKNLGKNLKQQCIDYLDKLFKEKNK